MICTKVRYPDEAWAKRALVKIWRTKDFFGDRAERRQECRAYECHLCGGWHLTSKPLRETHPSTGEKAGQSNVSQAA